MKNFYTLSFLAFGLLSNAQINVGITGNVAGVYINEIHYDNEGADINEFIEVAGPAGTDLSAYTITLYNGNDNTSYDTIHLSGIIASENSGTGTVSFAANGIQNGAPDGIALSKTGNSDIQFLSYEGVMSAVDGSATGLNSVDISVSESGTTPIGYSLEYDESSNSWMVSTDDTPGVFTQGATLSSKSNKLLGLRIYPNPVANGILNVETQFNKEKTITFYNILGKEITTKTTSEINININELPKGMYLVKIEEEGSSVTEKLIIE